MILFIDLLSKIILVIDKKNFLCRQPSSNYILLVQYSAQNGQSTDFYSLVRKTYWPSFLNNKF